MWLLVAIQLNVASPEYLEHVAEALPLSSAARDYLLTHGVVVASGVTAPSFTRAYDDLTSKQMPVLVTGDSILHACGWGLAGISRDLEQYVFAPRLQTLLWKLWRHTPNEDLDTGHYLAMAVKLLTGDGHFPNCPRAIDPWLAELEHRTPRTIEIFGARRTIDPADFEPRGHYRSSKALMNYWRAMAWLDRVELRMDRPRERAAAKAITEGIDATGERAEFEKVFILMGFVDGRSLEGSPDSVRRGLACDAFRLFGPRSKPELLHAADAEIAADAPGVFRSEAWKTLKRQAKLAVEVESRVDTLAKAERGDVVAAPPAVYVEPCSELFERLAALYRFVDTRINPELEAGRLHTYLAESIERLEALRNADAIESLAWYPRLFYGAHVDPSRAGAPESLRPAATARGGVGEVHFAAVIVEGTAYVGPVYSYYELGEHGAPDESAWRARLRSKPPPMLARALVK